MSKLILITRPAEDAETLSQAAAARGFATFSEPMLAIRARPDPLPELSAFQGLVFTSANAVRVFSEKTKDRRLPVYTVGRHTAETARNLGFRKVESAHGTAEDLAAFLKARNLPGDKALLHVRGAEVQHPIKEALKDHLVQEAVLYEADKATRLSPELLRRLDNSEIAAVLFFSPRTAETFTALLEQYGRTHTVHSIKALCLSEAVLKSVSVLPWNKTYVAQRPDQASMLALLEEIAGAGDIASTKGPDMSTNDQNALANAHVIIERFGGIRPMASKINVPVTTVQGWKKRDVIPGTRRDDIIQAARTNNIDISDILRDAPPANENSKHDEPDTQQPQQTAQQPAPQAAPPVHQPSPEATARTREHQKLMAEITGNERAMIRASLWGTAALTAVVVLAGLFLLWPNTKTLQSHTEQINGLETTVGTLDTDVKDLNQRASFLKDLVPADMQKKLDDMQTQASNLQNSVKQLSTQAETISQTLLGADGGSLSSRLALLEEQIAQMTGNEELAGLVGRVRELEQSVEGQQQLAAAMEELRGLVTGMDNRMNAMDAKLEQAQASGGPLGQTLEGVSSNDLKAAAMLIAFSQLRDSLNRQAPFEDDLVLLEGLVGDDNPELRDALIRLAPHADGGVLTPQGLSQEFRGLAGDIVVSSLKGEDVSFREKAMARLNTLFQVEKDGEMVSGTDTQATVNRAQDLLDQGDVEGAIATLQTLEGDAAQTAQPFVQQAEVTLLTQRVQDMVQNMILTTAGGGTPTLDMSQIRQKLQSLIPAQQIVKDEASGVVILPHQPSGFKGFSPGQDQAP